MKFSFSIAVLLSVAALAHADDPPPSPNAPPPPIPRDHVDSTIVGDAAPNSDSTSSSANLTTSRPFTAGAPDLVRATATLNLTTAQKNKMTEVIESADAGAAILIRRENAVHEMLAATTSDDPQYAKLETEQASADARWKANRDGLRQSIGNLLTSSQRTKFESLLATQSR
jgi:Spy/CpxP family protein refolding chaperone